MGFDRIMDILKKAQRSYPAFNKRLVEAEALSRWEKAVGANIARHSRAIRVQDSILWVEVEHPIWKSELHHRKRQILEILNGQANSTTIKDILFLDPRGGRTPPGGKPPSGF